MLNDKMLADRYKICDPIGTGGMADVYIGEDARLNRKVAIKILKEQLANDPVFLARFRREAQSVAGLNSPNIVAVYDTGEESMLSENGIANSVVPYIVMEYVEGRTLKDILATDGHLSVSDSAEIMQGVLGALAYSHKNGIIHRDIKPANVMITNTGAVKVMDFGIARAVVDSAATMTQSQGVVGTAQYLSPEQARGETVDFRSDLYSAGCLFFELLTGRPPFIGDSPVSIAYQHVREAAPKPSELNKDVPKSYDTIIAKALAKDVNSRYADADQFLGDLSAAADGKAISSAPKTDPDATQVLTPDQVNAINGFTPDETMRMDSIDGNLGFDDDFEGAISEYNHSDDAAAVREELDAEEAKRKKIIIISAIAGGVVLLGVILFVIFGVFGNKEAEKVKVPTVAKNMSSQQACDLIKKMDLECEIVDDNDSAEDKGKFTGQDPAANTEVNKGSTVKVKFSTGPADSTIPSKIKGMSVDDAKKALKDAGYTVSDSTTIQKVDCVDPTTLTSDVDKLLNEGACDTDADKVAGTKPGVGTKEKKGTTVTIYVASGVAIVPNLTGKSPADAQKIIEGMKLKFKQATETVETDSVKEGLVAEQSPVAGSVNTKDKPEITVKLAKAPAKPTIPTDIIGKTAAEAQASLTAIGLDSSITYEDTENASLNNHVKNIYPAPGTQVNKGDKVALVVYKYVAKPTPSPSESD